MGKEDVLPPAIFLMGPTASGKTDMAVELVQRLPLEIISVDSALVYRHMNIGTAKPDAETLRIAPHHLIDVIEPTKAYSAAQFRTDALKLMADISARGKVPLLTGGTMLYFKALREGLSDLPSAHPVLRAEIEAWGREAGWPALHAELARLDPQTAARLAPTDAQRIQRALEVIRLTGEPYSVQIKRRQEEAFPYRVLPIAIVPGDRAVLHRRIAERFVGMLRKGLIEEVLWLRTRYALGPQLPSMRCVGYRQVWQYLEGELPLSELPARGIYATRQLAKRQLTWLRAMSDAVVFDCFDPTLATRLDQAINRFLE
ncbi:tRNA (adenosine(37)-N6)-dimethylallyltransferase MiaA [Thiobacter aerophilum]|uniref:tRNA dimethylallyltransferase n=1 Tax=Thiobacter aerophilum TaxID=3121275 RepID=A0ABV0EEM5_9BURK